MTSRHRHGPALRELTVYVGRGHFAGSPRGMFHGKPRKVFKKEAPGWRDLVTKIFNPDWGPGQASLEMLCLGCNLESGRQQLVDEVGQGRTFQTRGLAHAQPSRGSPGWRELRVRRRWPEVQQGGRKAQIMKDPWLGHLIFILKAQLSLCRVSIKGAVCAGECHWLQYGGRVGREPTKGGPARRLLHSPGDGGVDSTVPAGSQGRSVEKGVCEDGISWGRSRAGGGSGGQAGERG